MGRANGVQEPDSHATLSGPRKVRRQECMRGLGTRVALAHARVLFWVDAAAANGAIAAVRRRAQADGWRDASEDISSVPTMFADEPNLAYNWELGCAQYLHHRASLADGVGNPAQCGAGLSMPAFDVAVEE